MAVMTHAQIHSGTADYNAMDEAAQDRFDDVMERADTAGPGDGFPALMLAAAAIAGLHIPYGAEIRRCACSCYCGVIFNPADPDAHVIEQSDGYNLGRIQCPTCADHHRETA
ncbi:hypothetical protein [Streptomyces sp. Da 82-17]|uniref:hypothetical protein n=1 Tax=Streptomyces sp. Da 82-17 TaxID=3377116 RepID=UPI0038D3C4F1